MWTIDLRSLRPVDFLRSWAYKAKSKRVWEREQGEYTMALFSDGGFCRQAYQETKWHRPHPCPRCSSVGATTTTTAISLIIMASSPFSSTLLHCSMSVRTLVMTSRIPYHHHHHCHHHHQRHQCASFFHFFPKTSEPPHTLWLHQHGHQGITPSPTPLFTLFSSFFFFFFQRLTLFVLGFFKRGTS